MSSPTPTPLALPTLLLVHGMCGSAQTWQHWRPFLEAQGFACVVPSLRHHAPQLDAASRAALGRTSLHDYVDDLAQLIGTLPTKPVIIGHSMGGLLTQMLAARGLAQAVVLLTPAPPAGILALKPSVLRTFARVTNRWRFWEKPFRFDAASARYGILNNLPPARQQEEIDQMVDESGRAAFEIGYWFFDRRQVARVNAAHVTCPVLVVAGGKDRITPARVVQQVAKKYPQATHRFYPQFAHMVVCEDGWQTLASDVVAWIRAQHQA